MVSDDFSDLIVVCSFIFDDSNVVSWILVVYSLFSCDVLFIYSLFEIIWELSKIFSEVFIFVSGIELSCVSVSFPFLPILHSPRWGILNIISHERE